MKIKYYHNWGYVDFSSIFLDQFELYLIKVLKFISKSLIFPSFQNPFAFFFLITIVLKLYYSNWSGSQHIPQIIKNTEQIIQKLIIKYPSRKTKQKKMVQEMGLTCRDWVFWVDSSRVCCGVGTAVDIDEAIMDENLVVVIPILLFLSWNWSFLKECGKFWRVLTLIYSEHFIWCPGTLGWIIEGDML